MEPLSDLLSRAGLLVLGLGDEGNDAVLSGARLRHPDLAVHRVGADRRLGAFGTPRLLILKDGVLLSDLDPRGLPDHVFDKALASAAIADPAEAARRALDGFDAPGPPEAKAFANGIAGRYRHERFDGWTLALRAWGECEQQDLDAGVQGSSSETRRGRWATRPDGRLDLRWTSVDSEVEVGMGRDRSSRTTDATDVVRVRWDGGRATGLRFDDGLLPGVRPADVYRRLD